MTCPYIELLRSRDELTDEDIQEQERSQWWQGLRAPTWERDNTNVTAGAAPYELCVLSRSGLGTTWYNL